MAVALVGSGRFNNTSGSIDATGATALYAFIQIASTDAISSVAYNGVAMTQKATVAQGANGVKGYLYILAQPASGAHNLTYTLTPNAGTTLVTWLLAVSSKPRKTRTSVIGRATFQRTGSL